MKDTVIEKLNAVFGKHPEVERVIVYGSRAKGNFKNGSDIDLTMEGEYLNLSKQYKIENEMDDLLLPYMIDLSIMKQIQNPDLLDHIARVGKVFYQKEPSKKQIENIAEMEFNAIKKIYFIGIGGIGMSALARYFRLHGAEVHGYDRTETELTRALASEGMQVHYEDDVKQIPQGVDLVVWTPAVPKDHAELNWFIERNYPLKKRAEVLGIISRAKKCVAIAGTHGKTTTSIMAAHLLRASGVDATAFVGGISANLGSNFVQGKSDWVVVEADEYDRSFLHLSPDVAVLNSLDPDHLDIYGTPEAVVDSYKQFARQIKPGGKLIYKHGLPLEDVAEELLASGRYVFTFGIEEGYYEAYNVRVENGQTAFGLKSSIFDWSDLRLNYPGDHNVLNATAAIAATLAAGGFSTSLKAALEGFKGVKRRFETIVKTAETVYVDDYAHHPAELEATIQAARSLYPGKRLTGVFQPHLFTRTRDFADGFATALDKLDECLLLPIYPARELPIPGVTSEMLLDKMTLKNKQLVQKNELLQQLKIRQPVILLTMGAGDIDTLVEPIKQMINEA
ncbi:MAG: UDP-N-acetylmuramate--L-alanine ligase [Saprospiraceae bacterium]